MATGQVALTRHKTPVPASRTSRQVVPAFLQKLHEMVNDPNNADLIRWSEAGDSFYVLDHERFAREVLGRWFKHQNFASFVRQLNMYGFHKIPHLQQGVLRSDTDVEFWNFAHANFHRGQPDLLCLIQRKKQSAQGGDDIIMELHENKESPAQSTSTSSQVVDGHSIVNGIAAIKRHQSAISAELNELKRSNQMLWQDAMDARTKHQKQQDTINRIVKFLAGVFGPRAGPHKEDVVESNPSRAVVPRRVPRFLIEDGRSGKVTIEEERDVSEAGYNEAGTHSPYPTIETPASVPSPLESGRISPDPYLPSYQSSPFEQPLAVPPASDTTYHATPEPTQQQSRQTTAVEQPVLRTDVIERSVTPSRSPIDVGFDPRVQFVLNQLTPLQIQQLLSSLSHTMEPMQGTDPPSSQSQLTQYTPTSDLFNQFINPISPPHRSDAPTADSLLSFDDHPDTVSFHDSNLSDVSKSWKAAEDIERDVNAVSSDIETFIRGLGLDPQHLVTPSASSSPSTSSLNLDSDDAHAEPSPQMPLEKHSHTDPPPPAIPPGEPMFDFDSFLNSFTTAGGSVDPSFSNVEPFVDMDPEPVALDSHPPQPPLLAQTLPAHKQGAPIPGVRAIPATKRKSDVSDHVSHFSQAAAVTTTDTHTPAPKSTKRRRNK